MGTIFLLAFTAIVSLFLLALLIGILGKRNKITKVAFLTLYVLATLFVSGYAFNALLEYNVAFAPIMRLLLSFAAFGVGVGASCLIYLQAAILADVSKDKLKENLKAYIEKISLPTVNISQTTGKFVRMAYSLFL